MPETLVVDCSVAAKWVLHETDRPQALRLLQQEKTGEVSLISPDLLLTEFASLLAKRTRRKQMSLSEAQDAFRLLEDSAPVLFETLPLLEPALNLALQNHMSLWDCVYLALAIDQNCAFITADRRLFRGHSLPQPAIRLLNSSDH
ncbi:MAG: type II toxin-antitoxin system VapC family toxin [Bryobacteraceae bacterium]